MLARPLRAIGLVLNRLARPILGRPGIARDGGGRGDGVVVFRHYL